MRYRYVSHAPNKKIRWACLKYNSLKKSKMCHDDIFKLILVWRFHWKLFEANDRIIGKMVDDILGYGRYGKL